MFSARERISLETSYERRIVGVGRETPLDMLVPYDTACNGHFPQWAKVPR
jgi:hypothetical protein